MPYNIKLLNIPTEIHPNVRFDIFYIDSSGTSQIRIVIGYPELIEKIKFIKKMGGSPTKIFIWGYGAQVPPTTTA